MSRVGAFDGEIGRGRRRDDNDSSSSRESSPARSRPKRSFSPVLSDDDNAPIGPTEDNDDTPPPNVPIIRRPLGFAADPPTQVPVSTYDPAPTPQAKKTFLPGQEVSVPSIPKAPSKRNKTGIKRPRRQDAYSGQTTRFRLETYDPTPSVEPPIAHGNGPYSSMYRGVVTAVAGQEGQKSTEPVHLNPATPSSRTASPNAIHLTLPPQSIAPPAIPFNAPVVVAPMAPVPQNSAGPTGILGSAHMSILPVQQPQMSQLPPALGGPIPTPVEQRIAAPLQPGPNLPSTTPTAAPSPGHATYVTDTSMNVHDRTSPGPYYRRNYEDREMTPPGETSRSLTVNTKSSTSDAQSAQKKNRNPLRIVTLLIEDMRSSELDSQLAEVKVPLRRLDDGEEGWWADAKDIAEQLQSGPSRIDGPARAFTMRNKYRQFILRVTAENKDEFMSANVAVSAHKTLDIIVELLHPPGTIPKLPRIRRDSWSNLDDDRLSDEHTEIDSVRPGSSSRKRASSPSFDDYDNYSTRHSRTQIGPNKAARHEGWDRSPRPERAPSYSRDQHSIRSLSAEPDDWRPRRPPPPRERESSRQPPPPSYSPTYHRPASPLPPIKTAFPSSSHLRTRSPSTLGAYSSRPDDEEEDYASADEPFIRAVDRLLREDEVTWNDFFRASAGLTANDVAKQYELVTKMMKLWVGRRPPGFHQNIEEVHIARALEIEEEDDFLSKCHETMSLLILYGKQGRRNEDPRVIEMLKDQRMPPVGTDTSKKLLRLLRAVDDAWKNNRTGTLLNGINPPPPDPYDRPGPYSPNILHSAVKSPTAPTLPPPLISPTSRQHSFRDSQSHPHVHSVSNRPAPSHSGSMDTTTPADAPRYVSRGKGLFVD